MISIPRLTEKQKNNLDEMMKMQGWKIIEETIEHSIKQKNIDLINWDFKFDEKDDVVKSNVRKYKEAQMEAGLLKEFLQFIRNPVTVKKEAPKGVYD